MTKSKKDRSMIFCDDPNCHAACDHCARCLIRRGHPHMCTATGDAVDPTHYCPLFYCTLAEGADVLKLERWATHWLYWTDKDIEMELAPWPEAPLGEPHDNLAT